MLFCPNLALVPFQLKLAAGIGLDLRPSRGQSHPPVCTGNPAAGWPSGWRTMPVIFFGPAISISTRLVVPASTLAEVWFAAWIHGRPIDLIISRQQPQERDAVAVGIGGGLEILLVGIAP